MVTITETLATQEIRQARRARHLAFFLPGFIDFSGISSIRNEILASAGVIRRQGTKLDENVLSVLKLGLEESVDALRDTLSLSQGALAIVMPRALERHARAQALIDDYSVGAHDDYRALVIPMDRITARVALSHPGTPTEYEPAIDIRVKTSHDVPIKVYGGPAQIIETPSLGSWHRFPLGQVELAIVSEP